jgi:hypothetical protein
MKPVEALLQSWRSEAEMFEDSGHTDAARTAERYAARLENALREQELEELSVRNAAQESGYSEEHLRQLVRDGKLPDSRSPNSKGPITIRRCDLPRKPRSSDSVVLELAEALRRP